MIQKEWVRCMVFFGGLLLVLAGTVFTIRFFAPGVPALTPNVLLQLGWRSGLIVIGVCLFLWAMDVSVRKRGVE